MNRMHPLALMVGMGDRENSDERPRDTLMLSRENSDVRAPRESVSWSMGDHQRIRGQSPMRSAERLHNNAMHNIQNKVSQLENTLQSVTAELRNVVQNFSARNTEARSRVRVDHTHDEIPNRRRFRPGGGNHALTSSNSDEESSCLETASHSRIKCSRRNPKLPPFTGKETWKVWFNRFEEVANRQNWTSEEKLMSFCLVFRA